MNVDLDAKQLFVIKLALAQLEPVDPATLNQTRQLIDSSINLYPGEAKPLCCIKCEYIASERDNTPLGHFRVSFPYCSHLSGSVMGRMPITDVNYRHKDCPFYKEANNG